MICQQGYTSTGLLIVLMEDPILHTDTHPFCRDDPTCPCHRYPELLAEVAEAVAQGRLTQEEAAQVIAGQRGF